jgi:hypothetical protein
MRRRSSGFSTRRVEQSFNVVDVRFRWPGCSDAAVVCALRGPERVAPG